MGTREEMDIKIQEIINWKAELPLSEQLEYLFDELDEFCCILAKNEEAASLDRKLETNKLPREEILDYYSKYNLNKRLMRNLTQSCFSIMEYLRPEIFKAHKEKERQQLMKNRCRNCGVGLTTEECETISQLCSECIIKESE